MTTIPILNPELTKRSCCGYGDWFALDLLVELWQKKAERHANETLSRTCPSCGAKVTVNWDTESVTFEPIQDS